MRWTGTAALRGRVQQWAVLLQFSNTGDRLLLVLAIILSLCSGATEPAMSIFFARFFSTFSLFDSGKIDGIEFSQETKRAIINLAAISAIMLVVRSGYMCFWIVFGETQAAAARKALFRATLKGLASSFNSNNPEVSDQPARFQTCIRDFQLGVSQPLGFLLSHAAQCVTALIIAFYYQWRLALLMFSAILLSVICLATISKTLPAAIENQQAELIMASRIVSRVVDHVAVVKYCNAQKQERTLYCKLISRAAAFYMQQVKINSGRIGFTGFVMTLILVAALFCADQLIHHAYAVPTAAMTTFFCCLMATQGFQNMMPHLLNIEKGCTAASVLCKMSEKAQQPRQSYLREHKLSPTQLRGDILFDKLSFAYSSRPGHLILDKVDVVFRAEKLSFLVGKSGSGKSTVANLLQANTRPLGGTIFIDGIDTRRLDEDWLRNNITIVRQDPHLFNETIFQNVIFGRRDDRSLDKTQVMESLKFAQILPEVKELPNGMETMLGPGEYSLSGGQRQRLVLARANLRDTPILILDEPTASLDPHLRSHMMRNLREWRKGKTTIIITHDLSQIHDDDAVYVVDDGTVRHTDIQLLRKDRCASEHGYSTNDNSAVRQVAQHDDQNHLRTLRRWKYLNHTRMSWHRLSILEYPENQHSGSLTGSEVAHMSAFHGIVHEQQDANPISEPLAETTLAIDDKPSSESLSGFLPILKSILPAMNTQNRTLVLVGFVVAAAYASCPAIFAYLVVQDFENWSRQEQWQERSLKIAVAGIGLAVADGTFSFLSHYIFELVAQHWVDYLRVRALAHILQQPKSWFDQEWVSASDICTTLHRDTEELRNILGRYCLLALVAFTMTAVALIWSFKVCWKITLATIACIPVLYACTETFQRCSQYWEVRTSDAEREINLIFVEVQSNIETVQDLTLESHFHRKYLRATTKAFRVGIQRGLVTGLTFGLTESAVYFVTTAIFAFGSFLVKVGDFRVAAILQSFALLLFSTSNASSVIAYIPQISSSLNAGLKLIQLTKSPLSSCEEEGSIRLHQLQSELGMHYIGFRKFNFNYLSRPEAIILSSLDLQICPGIWTAIVGSSGSGKSTLVSLLMKLYARVPDENIENTATNTSQISVFGHNINQIDAYALRQLIAVVPQHPFIMSGTVRQNILYGDLPKELNHDANMYEAAKVGMVDDFVKTLPNLYETVIGEAGASLSGGQAQRIAIARAIARQPRVLILDEATSALDEYTAREVRHSIKVWAQGRSPYQNHVPESRTQPKTIISVTHDIEMMKFADQIVLLKDGTVAEQGTFQELIEMKSMFWDFLSTTEVD